MVPPAPALLLLLFSSLFLLAEPQACSALCTYNQGSAVMSPMCSSPTVCTKCEEILFTMTVAGTCTPHELYG